MEDDRQRREAAVLLSARPCFQCGICASSCPVYRVAPAMNPRLSVDSILNRGVLPPDGTEWLCAYCLLCDQRCPMGVSLTEILMVLKNISTRQGQAPQNVVTTVTSILESGCVIADLGRVEKLRSSLGLPELPKPDMQHIEKIVKMTGASTVQQREKEEEAGRR
jgi:heterodisulfide reductase subunit C